MSTSPPSIPTVVPADDGWRTRLLASLRDCGVQRSPRNAAGYWVLAVFLIIVLAAVSGIMNHMIKENLRTEGDQIAGWVIRGIWALFAIFVLCRIRNRLLRGAWQSNSASAEDELERPDARRPILYLRSFQLDERINQRTWPERFLGAYPSETAEQAMTKVLKSTGPAIAIGRPDEQLPALGAARFYVSHDRWQQKVADVTAEAQFVVWATGVTEGLRWEISHLVATVPPEKVILWAHPHLLQLAPREREAEWAKFRTTLGGVFPKPLPERLGEARFIYFTAGWEPHAVAPPRKVMPWFNPIRAALGAVLGIKTGVAVGFSGRRWAARLGRLGIGLALGAILAAILSFSLSDHSETDIVNGQTRHRYTYTSDFSAFVMVVDIAIAGLTLSLGFGSGAAWRRARSIGVVLLAGVAVMASVIGLQEQLRMAGTTTRRDLGNNYSMNGQPLDAPIITNTVREVTFGAYFKIGAAVAIAAAAIGLMIVGWRRKEAELPRVLLTAAEVDYAGPGDDTFADLIGATGAVIFWPRVAGLFVAIAATKLLPSLIIYQEFSLRPILWAALVTAAAVAAFRFLRAGVAPLAAATVVAIIWSVAVTEEYSTAPARNAFIETVALLAGLSWATRRMGPRPFALWFGAMWQTLAALLLLWDRDFSGLAFLAIMLGPVVFAAIFEVVIRKTPLTAAQPAAAM
jgi:hypothetical protein